MILPHGTRMLEAHGTRILLTTHPILRHTKMLVTLKEALEDARSRHYAVPAFNVTEDVMARTVMETAEAKRAPVILSCLGAHLAGNGWTYLAGLIKMAAGIHDVPIVLHLDHATDPKLIGEAVDNGFTGVMIDGSSLPFEENAAATKAVVDIAGPKGVSVEAELGHVGGMDLQDAECAENVLTEPDEVARFVDRTGIDALAVSIGTAHGMYRAEPTLNIDRLVELDAASRVPLVLHGGSGTPDEMIREAVRHGICKMNIYTDERVAMNRGVDQFCKSNQRIDPLPEDLFGSIKKELSALVAEKIELLLADGKA